MKNKNSTRNSWPNTTLQRPLVLGMLPLSQGCLLTNAVGPGCAPLQGHGLLKRAFSAAAARVGVTFRKFTETITLLKRSPTSK